MQIAIKLSNYYKIEKRSQHFISWKCASNLLSKIKFQLHSERFFCGCADVRDFLIQIEIVLPFSMSW